jgi:formylglycine-generating enzyme required for sulfatase activity
MADMTSYGGNGINQPATGITWTEAAIFINWLNTSKGFSPAYKIIGTTFSVWSSNDIGFNPNNSFRNTQAKYFLPSTNEWWKGAYGSPDGSWSIWPTGSNTLPESISGGPVGMVYGQAAPAEITNAGSPSKWGTEAQGGNVWEWTETAKDGINDSPSETRELLGGSWWYGSGYASAYGRPDPDVPNIVFTNQTGLRVAMVPEPSSLSLLLAGVAVLMAGRRRKS